MERNCYFDIPQSMLGNDLTPKELITFALIHSHSKEQGGYFYGSLKHIASWLNIRSDKVCAILSSLCKKNLISKEKVSTLKGERCRYKTNIIYTSSEGENRIRVYSYMTKLNLKARELLLFALIDGFSHAKYSSYFKKNSEIAMWLGINPKHVSRYVAKLINKGLISVTPEGSLTSLSHEAYQTALNNIAGVNSVTIKDLSISSACTKKGSGVTKTGDNNVSYSNKNLNKANILNNTSISNICSVSSVVDSILSKSLLEQENLDTFGCTGDNKNAGLTFLNETISHYSSCKRSKLLEMSELNARYLYNLAVSLTNDQFSRYFFTIKSKVAFIKAQINKIIDKSDCCIYRNLYKLAYESNTVEFSIKRNRPNDIGVPKYVATNDSEVDLVALYEKLGNFEAAEEERQKRLIVMNH